MRPALASIALTLGLSGAALAAEPRSGEEDGGIPADSVRAFEAKARGAGVSADFKVYPGAGHAFASSRDPGVFRPESARDADARTDAFLARVLSP